MFLMPISGKVQILMARSASARLSVNNGMTGRDNGMHLMDSDIDMSVSHTS